MILGNYCSFYTVGKKYYDTKKQSSFCNFEEKDRILNVWFSTNVVVKMGILSKKAQCGYKVELIQNGWGQIAKPSF